MPLFPKERRAFVLHRLFSLTGVFPVGVFLVVHLWSRASALRGREHFDSAVTSPEHTPYLLFFEVVFVLLPLLFHALYGIGLTFGGRWNVGRYGHSRNWMYVLQRVTGLIAFAFIAYHFYEFRLQILLGKMVPGDIFPKLCASMSATITGGVPLRAILYLVGIGACVFHLANGLWGFCVTWGITVSRKSQRVAATAFGFVGILLFFLGANTLVYFATGSKLPLLGMADKNSQAISCADIE